MNWLCPWHGLKSQDHIPNHSYKSMLLWCQPSELHHLQVIWALASAPDPHWNIHHFVTSSNNSIQKHIQVARGTHLPDELSPGT